MVISVFKSGKSVVSQKVESGVFNSVVKSVKSGVYVVSKLLEVVCNSTVEKVVVGLTELVKIQDPPK